MNAHRKSVPTIFIQRSVNELYGKMFLLFSASCFSVIFVSKKPFKEKKKLFATETFFMICRFFFFFFNSVACTFSFALYSVISSSECLGF